MTEAKQNYKGSLLLRQAPLAQNPMLAAYLFIMSKNNGLFYDETNENHLSNAKLESIKLLDSEIPIVELVFTKGTDIVKQYLKSIDLFEAVCQYNESIETRDVKTGFVYKGYYASGVVL